MISFLNNSNEKPFIIFKKKYDLALLAHQDMIEAISVSSYDKSKEEVDSRFVNLKIVDGNEFIFFTNYNSPKALQIKSHNQAALSIFWSSINVQIRMKGKITKKSKEYNNNYFIKRSAKKNALAISSNQSNQISSYDDVKKKFLKTYKNENLKNCPDYWGGFAFKPYEIEFWEGSNYRLNKREKFIFIKSKWQKFILEP